MILTDFGTAANIKVNHVPDDLGCAVTEVALIAELSNSLGVEMDMVPNLANENDTHIYKGTKQGVPFYVVSECTF